MHCTQLLCSLHTHHLPRSCKHHGPSSLWRAWHQRSASGSRQTTHNSCAGGPVLQGLARAAFVHEHMYSDTYWCGPGRTQPWCQLYARHCLNPELGTERYVPFLQLRHTTKQPQCHASQAKQRPRSAHTTPNPRLCGLYYTHSPCASSLDTPTAQSSPQRFIPGPCCLIAGRWPRPTAASCAARQVNKQAIH